MGKSYSILHISDLHRSPDDPISNHELISALVRDRDEYSHEQPTIPLPEAIVVSGDLIRGVPLKTPNYADELSRQYAVAEEFLDNLVKRFLSGDRSRLVIIPGNHDVDWNTAFNSMHPVDAKDFPPDLGSVLYHENSNYRWDWKTLTLYRIADPRMYALRLESFWKFFERFYSGVDGLYKVEARTDANLFLLCDNRIGVAAFNSCHGNDCFAFHGMIRKEVVAQSHLDLNDSGKVFDLLMAVWHHNIEGPPYRTDYMDVDIVRGMIGRGFRLGLYGHQHKAQVTPHQIWLPDRERMAVVSAGSLCAGHRELPTGTYRQYNILEIDATFTSVRVHVRTMAVSNLFSRGRLVDFGDKSYADLDWERPRNAVGGRVDTKAARLSILVGEAELAAKTGNPTRAVELLRSLELPIGSYERQLLVSAAHASENWSAIIEKADPPTTIEELVYRVEALRRLGGSADAMAALDKFAHQVNLPEAEAKDLRFRIKTQEKISQ
jgi:Calcineurin-like phosphoesterase